MEGAAKSEMGLLSIAASVRNRGRDLARASFVEIVSLFRNLPALIIPSLIHEELSVEEASQRSAILMRPIRQRAAYPLFRRVLAFALNLTALQAILLTAAYALDRRIFIYPNFKDALERSLYFNHAYETLKFWLPMTLTIGIAAFSASLKNGIEQAVLYLTARRTLGEIPVELSTFPPHHEVGAIPARRWTYLKTYAPTCVFAVMMIGFHLYKFPLMTKQASGSFVHTVKSLHACGVPIPARALELYSPDKLIPLYPGMAKFLIEKGANVNAPISLRSWIPPEYGEGASKPLMAALLYGPITESIDTARLLIENGADVRETDSIGQTPMTVASVHCPQAIGLLLAYGVDINAADNKGRTPLRHFHPSEKRKSPGEGAGAARARIRVKSVGRIPQRQFLSLPGSLQFARMRSSFFVSASARVAQTVQLRFLHKSVFSRSGGAQCL